jgi:hypothetical protein
MMSMRNRIMCGSVLFCWLFGTVALSQETASRSAKSELAAEVSFSCLWWSEAQMEGLNPNSPPPKATETKLTKWEYSDPIGVPHPDTVDIAVALNNKGKETLSSLEVEIAAQWLTGPLGATASGGWSERIVLKRFQGINLEPGGTQTLRVPIDLKNKMDALEKQKKWPYSLRASAEVRQPGTGAALAQARADLPIKQGD